MANTRNISFHLNAPEASSVAIAGDFNSWGEKTRQLRRRKDGVWWTVLRLTPGVYQYKFVVDGCRWEEDPANPNRVPNAQGTLNSVCEVT